MFKKSRRNMISSLVTASLLVQLMSPISGAAAERGAQNQASGGIASLLEQAFRSGDGLPGTDVTSLVYGVNSAAVQSPVLDALPAITNQEKIAVTGTAQPGAAIRIYLTYGGQEPSYTGEYGYAEDDGRFSVEVWLLPDSENILTATAEVDRAESPHSMPASVFCDRTAPGMPDHLRWLAPREDTIRLEWQAPSRGETPSKYVIYRDDQEYATTGSLFFEDTDLDEQVGHKYDVSARDEAGNESVKNWTPAYAGTPDKEAVKLEQPGRGEVGEVTISQDGSTVAYEQYVQDDSGEYTVFRSTIFVQSLATGQVQEVNLNGLQGEVGELHLSKNGKALVFSIKTDDDEYDYHQNDIYIKDLADDTLKRVTTDEIAGFSAFLSADGDTVTFTQGENYGGADTYLIYQYSRSRDVLTPVHLPPAYPDVKSEVVGMKVSDDGKWIAYVARDYKYYTEDPYPTFLYSMDTGIAERIGNNMSIGGFSGDNGKLVYETNGSVYLYDVAAKSSALVLEGSDEISYSNPLISADGSRVIAGKYANSQWSFDREQLTIYELSSGHRSGIGNPAFYKEAEAFTGNGSKVVYRTQDASTLDHYGANYLYCASSCGAVEQPPGNPIDTASWQAPQMIGSQAALGSDLELMLKGAAGQSVKAVVTYKSFAEPGQAGIEKTDETPLTETAGKPGSYSGKFPLLPGIGEIVAMRFEAKDSKGVVTSRQAEYLPLVVSGAMKVKLQSEDQVDLADGKIVAWSAANRASSQAKLNGTDEVLLAVAEAADNRVSWIDSSNRKLAEVSDVQVRRGLVTEALLMQRNPVVLTVKVRNEQQETLPNIPVTIRSRDTGSLIAYGRTNQSGTVSFQAGYLGDKVKVEAALTNPYQPFEPMEVTLLEDGEAVVTAKKMTGFVEGIVTEAGVPVPDVRVTLSQAGSTVAAVTDGQGRYKVQGPVGLSKIEAVQQSFPYMITTQSQQVSVLPNGTTQKDLFVQRKAQGTIFLKLFTQYMDSPRQQVDLDWSSTIHFHVGLKDENGGYYPASFNNHDQFTLMAEVGQKFQVCANGYEGQLSEVCQTVTMDSSRTASAELELVEKESIIGKADIQSPGNFPSIYSTLYKLDADGKVEGYGTGFSSSSRDLKIPVPRPGTYQLYITARDYSSYQFLSAVKTIVVEPGKTADLGTIRLTSDSVFDGREGNYLTSLTGEVGEAGTFTLSGTYRNGSKNVIRDAVLLLRIPSGAVLKEQSVMLNGSSVAPRKVSEALYEVPVGTLNSSAGGSISYRLAVAAVQSDYIRPELGVRYLIEGGGQQPIEEIIDSTFVKVTKVSLVVDPVVSSTVFDVTGQAPAGEQVYVYDGDVLVGQSQASPGGFWGAKVELPDRSPNRMHLLHARVVQSGKALNSLEASVEIAPDKPQLQQFTMRQSDGRQIDLKTSEGYSRFPYVVIPGNPILFSLKFNEPARVDQVKVHMGDLEFPAVYNEKTKAYEAVKPGPHYNLNGDISVSYDTKEPAYQVPELTLEEATKLLPQELQQVDSELVEETPPDAPAGRTYLPKVVIKPKEYASESIDVQYYYEPVEYTPEPVPDGEPPVYDQKVVIDSAGKRVTVSSIIDVDQFDGQTKLRMGFAPEIHGTIRIGASVKFDIKTPGAGSPLGLASAIYAGYDFKSKMGELEDFLHDVEAGSDCTGPILTQMYQEQVQDLAERLFWNLATKYAMQLGSMALASSGIGLIGGALVLGTSIAVNVAMNHGWKKSFENLKDHFKEMKKDAARNNPECDDDDDDDDRKPPKKPKQDRKPVGKPTWIYDPSGYTFEAVPSNRVEGVTATIMQQDEGDGLWHVWDADWFGQQNPLVTDKQGRYGWDVPEGKWQVKFDKEGYETAYSEQLTVLPPHLDVNVPMISLAAPEVTSVVQVESEGKQALQINFSKYMITEAMNSQNIAVLSDAYENGQLPIPLQIVPVAAENGTDGKPLAKAVRLIPSDSLGFAPGQSVQITVRSAVSSYAGIPMADAFRAQVAVAEHPPLPEEAVDGGEGIDLSGGSSYVTARWTLKADARYDQLRVKWKADGDASWKEADLSKGEDMFVVGKAAANTKYEVRVVTVLSGLESAGVGSSFVTAPAPQIKGDRDAPKDVTAAKAVSGERRIDVSWTDPDDFDLYQIALRLKKPGELSFGEPVRVGKGTGSYSFASLAAGGRYEMKLTAIDASGNESAGVIVTADLAGSNTGSGTGSPGGGGTPPADADVNQAELAVSANGGDYSAFDGSLTLHVPKGAFAGAAKLKLGRKAAADAAQPSYVPVSDVYSIAIDGGQAALGSVHAAIGFDLARIKGYDVRRFGLYKRDAADPQMWHYAGGVVDASNNRIEADVSLPGEYAVLLYDRSFGDLSGHWSRSEVEVLISRHIVDGMSADQFAPDRLVTRAEMVKLVLARLLPQQSLSDPAAPGQVGFTDVPVDAWHYRYIEAAHRLGLVEGADGRFRPDDPVTREEMVTLLARAAGVKLADSAGASASESYRDAADISGWAKPAMEYALASGLIQGVSDTELMPKAPASRAQAAAVLLRAMERSGLVSKR